MKNVKSFMNTLDKKKPEYGVNVYIVLLFAIYPLIFHDYYFDIVTSKYIVFLVMTAIMSIYVVMTEIMQNDVKLLKSGMLSKMDKAIICIWVANAVSVIFTDNKIVALNGTDGRNAGLFTITCYLVIFFVVTRFCTINNKIFMIITFTGVIVSLIGICNFLNIDIFGFYTGLTQGQKMYYISTLGHSNVYTSYFAILLPVTYICYTNSKKQKSIFWFIAAVISTLGMLSGQCESSFIIAGVSVVTAMLFCKQKENISRIPKVMLTVIILERILLFVERNSAEENTKLSIFVLKYLLNNRVFISLILINLIIIFLADRLRLSIKFWKIFFTTIILFIGITYIMLLLYFSTIGRKIDIGSFDDILRFRDSYGSYRGYIWRIVINQFAKLRNYQKVFGIGCDTLLPFLKNIYGEKMYKVTNAYYDNAHNEYLQYLITTGIVGLISYLAFVITSISNSVKSIINNKQDINYKNNDDKEFKEIILAIVICYLLQALVNINQVVTTPLFIACISMLNCKKIK